MRHHDDIIAAIATPVGEGSISVIRVSGMGAIELVDNGFRGKAPLRDAKTHTLHYGNYVDRGEEIIDEVVVSIFRAPNSYTGEDVVELSCHGGVYVSRRILESVIALGARLALPGEFTKRAFLNGRIDLSQAEAVADLIRARSERSRRNSIVQLQGTLSNEIKNLVNRLTHLCSLVELELDFAEEEVTLTGVDSIRAEIGGVIARIEKLIGSFVHGRLIREGVKVVLVGRPNAGKSSLLNALLDTDRAIVTEVPGTTRDVIEENVILDGVLFKLVDTAGIRDTTDLVEKIGVDRTKAQIQQADICLCVVDISKDELYEEQEFLGKIADLRQGNLNGDILIGNKLDISNQKAVDKLKYADCSSTMGKTVFLSAKTREGMDDLIQAILDLSIRKGLGSSDLSVTVTNERHKNELENAQKSLYLALDSLGQGRSGEVIALDLRRSLNFLGMIVGTVTTDDILNNIFSKFCIGK